MNDTIVATTRRFYHQGTNDLATALIVVNKPKQKAASQEFFVGSLMHEFVHAELNRHSKNLNLEDHTNMVAKYIEPFSGFLVNYSGISPQHAVALAWIGLEGTNAFKNAIDFGYPNGSGGTAYMTKGAMQSIQVDYQFESIGIFGTETCP